MHFRDENGRATRRSWSKRYKNGRADVRRWSKRYENERADVRSPFSETNFCAAPKNPMALLHFLGLGDPGCFFHSKKIGCGILGINFVTNALSRTPLTRVSR